MHPAYDDFLAYLLRFNYWIEIFRRKTMNIEKFTSKSQEALNSANAIAVEMNHQELVPLHVVLALIRDRQGLVPSILSKLDVAADAAENAALEILRKLPQVSGQGVQTYASRGLTAVLADAQRKTAQMKDDFVSVEHLFLAALDKDRDTREFGRRIGLIFQNVLEALKEVRGKQRVTSQDPEGTFNALEKYSRNLTETAKAGKLDPVIRSAGSSRSCRAAPRTTRCLSAIRVWERPRSWRDSPCASCAATFLKG
jgi:ATP-dependent Clp protease ATP-binding subunit ClpB